MPHYFVDFQDGDKLQHDDDGMHVENFDQARDGAIRMLPQVAKEELPDGEHRRFAATIRDESGTILYRATLTFHGERLSQPN